MKNSTYQEVLRVLRHYDADHDLGPDAPVTWREERLAQAVLELSIELADLKKQVDQLTKSK